MAECEGLNIVLDVLSIVFDLVCVQRMVHSSGWCGAATYRKQGGAAGGNMGLHDGMWGKEHENPSLCAQGP